MTLLQLQYFQVLSHNLHYTRTAEQLCISQPSLSYAINELEKELGVKLFQKENRKVPRQSMDSSFFPMWSKLLLFCRTVLMCCGRWPTTPPRLSD